MRRTSRHSSWLQAYNRPPMVVKKLRGAVWDLSLKWSLYARKPLTDHIPDAKYGPGPRSYLHHQVNVHKDAHQWKDRQSRDLWGSQFIPEHTPDA